MNEKTFSPGDVVLLKSGGIPMTVDSDAECEAMVWVIWLNHQGDANHMKVPKACLILADEDPRYQRSRELSMHEHEAKMAQIRNIQNQTRARNANITPLGNGPQAFKN